MGGAKTAGEDDDVGAREGDEGRAGKVREIVADDGLEGDLDAEVVKSVGEIEGVGVLAEGCEHLGASGDDFSDHVFVCKRFLVGRIRVFDVLLFAISIANRMVSLRCVAAKGEVPALMIVAATILLTVPALVRCISEGSISGQRDRQSQSMV